MNVTFQCQQIKITLSHDTCLWMLLETLGDFTF